METFFSLGCEGLSRNKRSQNVTYVFAFLSWGLKILNNKEHIKKRIIFMYLDAMVTASLLQNKWLLVVITITLSESAFVELLLRAREENEVSISSHIWVVSTIFKQLWNLKKHRKKLIYIFMPILGLAESFKTMYRPDQTRPYSNAL